MIMGRFSVRGVVLWSAGGLAGLLVMGGLLLALVESVTVLAGIWLAFNVLSTTGFGPGPTTAAGQVTTMALFMFGVVCWFGILVAAVEAASMRIQRHVLVDEALRPLARRPKSRLFHVN
jgi:hypothetical protein